MIREIRILIHPGTTLTFVEVRWILHAVFLQHPALATA